MTLLARNIVICDGVTLRPSLGAAYRIFSRFELPALIEKLLAFELGTIKEIVIAGSEVPDYRAIERMCGQPLGEQHRQISDALIQYVIALTGADLDKPEQEAKADKPKGKRFSYTDHCEQLFEIATGWLGWSPDVAWKATPAEILAGYRGKQAMLKAIFGTGEQQEAPITVEDKEAFLEAENAKRATKADLLALNAMRKVK